MSSEEGEVPVATPCSNCSSRPIRWTVRISNSVEKSVPRGLGMEISNGGFIRLPNRGCLRGVDHLSRVLAHNRWVSQESRRNYSLPPRHRSGCVWKPWFRKAQGFHRWCWDRCRSHFLALISLQPFHCVVQDRIGDMQTRPESVGLHCATPASASGCCFMHWSSSVMWTSRQEAVSSAEKARWSTVFQSDSKARCDIPAGIWCR